jgi:anti-sigma-K factor RskA
MNCDEVSELLPAYALGALDPSELEAVEAHLAMCDLHEEALAFELTGARLSELAPEMEPPAALRERILTAAGVANEGVIWSRPDAEAGRGVMWTDAETRGAPTGGAMSWWSAWLGRLQFTPYAAAAVLVLAVIGFVALDLLGDDGEGAVTRTASTNGVSTTLVYERAAEAGTISFEGLPALDAGSVYQLWTIAPDANPASAGLLERGDDGTASQAVAGDFADGTTFAITVEPAGGSEQPTTEPLIATQL